jgi:acyl-[acyl-carrier-protein]-phospholipid O-acyltransferase/long-chain-fatty-acid--[acyl-carrier-protein] ligase
MGLAEAFIRTCKQRKRGSKIADSTGLHLSGGELLMRSLILRRLLSRHVLGQGERFVGLLLPPSAYGVLANMALALDRRVPVNLNYSVSPAEINDCIAQAGIRHVLTSRTFMERLKIQLTTEPVYLEELRSQVTWADKLSSLLEAYAMPARLLARRLKLLPVQNADLATVIFTSGSTGASKGVMLTEDNIASNVAAIHHAVKLTRDDVVVGILPFFHAFGYTVTLWSVMTMDVKGIYHYSPLDAKQIGKLVKSHRGTVLVATPTFLRSYLRRCEPDELASLQVVATAAEKLPVELCEAFERKFGQRPVEGYGATELSPVAALNIPPTRTFGSAQVERKEGTVGRPVLGVSAKVTDLDTGVEVEANRPGMLWIKGPNVMQGYLGRDDLTAQVMRDGWYMTGDIALIDEDGFIQITGRQSRFSKIGGEMVPHIRVEETLARILGVGEDESLQVAVTAVPDERKGERLVVLHTKMAKTPDELRKGLSEAGLPNLFIPSTDSFHEVAVIPILGSGKVDLKGIKSIACEVFGEPR